MVALVKSELIPVRLLINPFVKVRPAPERFVVDAFVAKKLVVDARPAAKRVAVALSNRAFVA